MDNLCRYANELRADREETARVMKKDSVKGIWDSIKDKYTDKGHFVYELLQNADDAGATSAAFELFRDDVGDNGRLVFRHNGTKHFYISDPTSGIESEDKKNGCLGSVNAITSVAQSNKTRNSIGKFGVGFKSVFHYSLTPSVYDEGIRFRIDDYIVPYYDISDYPGRGEGETVFVIPFNRKELIIGQGAVKAHVPTKSECYEEIRDRIVSLKIPTLFLTNLRKIEYRCMDTTGEEDRSGSYFTDERERGCVEGISYSFIKYVHQAGENVGERYLWMFSTGKGVDDRCSVAFMAKEDRGLENVDRSFFAQCFFPTKVDMGLRYLAHAPFLLTESREGIVDDPHNTRLIERLAELTVASIKLLSGMTTSSGMGMYDEKSVNVFPIREHIGQDAARFGMFYEKTLQLFQDPQSKVIPSSNRYSSKANVVVAASQEMVKLFTREDIQILMKRDVEWAFPNVSIRSTADGFSDLRRFIVKIGLLKLTDAAVINRLTESFMYDKDLRWYADLHEWIVADGERTNLARCRPIFVAEDGTVVAAFNERGDRTLYLPVDGKGVPGCRTISHAMLVNAATVRLVKDAYRIPMPSPKERVLKFANEESADGPIKEHLDWFFRVFRDLATLSPDEQKPIVDLLKGKCYLGVDSAGQEVRRKAGDLYFPDAELKEYFGATPGIAFVNLDAYAGSWPGKPDALRARFEGLDVADLPRLKEISLDKKMFSVKYMSDRAPWAKQTWYIQDPESWMEYEYEGMLDILQRIKLADVDALRMRQSQLCWEYLCKIADRAVDHRFSSKLTDGAHGYQYHGKKKEPFRNYLLFQLRNAEWMFDIEGRPVSAASVTLQRLNETYKGSSLVASSVRAELQIKNDPIWEVISNVKRSDPRLAMELEKVVANYANGDFACNHAGGDADMIDEDGARQRRMGTRRADPYDNDVDYLALERWCQEKLENLRDLPCRAAEDEDPLNGTACARVISVGEYLKMNLRIPWYQRPYEWQERNVIDLLDDICTAAKMGNVPYRVGSVILQWNEDEKIYEIVDGQQRTLTFVLLCSALAVANVQGVEIPRCLANEYFYPALKQCRVSRRNLHNNFVIIDRYLKEHAEFDWGLALRQLEVVVIGVATQPEAFQLFDSQNSRGRRLAPHDLLKAYHLRAARGTPAMCIAQAVKVWEGHKSGDVASLFNDFLFRIYKWERMENCGSFTSEDAWVFKGIPMNWVRNKLIIPPYHYVRKPFCSRDTFQIGEPIVPGLDFFKMVENYFDLQKEIDCAVERELGRGLTEKYRRARGCAYAEQLFKAVLLCYFDRFGFVESDASQAIRRLFKWAYMVRVDLDYFGPKTPNKYALGGDGGYSNRCPMFARIKNARVHTEITGMTVNSAAKPTERWNELGDDLKNL